MNRPYVFCHMMCALDGKIMGGYMGTPQGRAAGDAFYDIAFGKEPFYHHRGWLSGRVTTDDNFTYQHRVGGGGRREPGYAAGFPSRRRHFGEQGPWLHAERGEGHGRRGGLAALWRESMILSRRFQL